MDSIAKYKKYKSKYLSLKSSHMSHSGGMFIPHVDLQKFNAQKTDFILTQLPQNPTPDQITNYYKNISASFLYSPFSDKMRESNFETLLSTYFANHSGILFINCVNKSFMSDSDDNKKQLGDLILSLNKIYDSFLFTSNINLHQTIQSFKSVLVKNISADNIIFEYPDNPPHVFNNSSIYSYKLFVTYFILKNLEMVDKNLTADALNTIFTNINILINVSLELLPIIIDINKKDVYPYFSLCKPYRDIIDDVHDSEYIPNVSRYINLLLNNVGKNILFRFVCTYYVIKLDEIARVHYKSNNLVQYWLKNSHSKLVNSHNDKITRYQLLTFGKFFRLVHSDDRIIDLYNLSVNYVDHA